MACDDAVLAETANPHGYATCLVSLLEKSLAHRLVDKRWSSSLAHAAVDRAREAALRLAQILDTKRPVATRVWKPALSMVAAFSVVCLMVLPHAPQFVAFDRTARVGTGALARPSRAQLGSNLRPQQTQIRYSEPPSVAATAKMKMAKAVHPRNASGNLLVPARIVAAPLNAEPPRDQVVAVSANADREIVPQFRTLVFIEATQYGTADSSVWSVQVWRVTWVSTVPAPLAAAPVANSI
jgi:hypothetical protein